MRARRLQRQRPRHAGHGMPLRQDNSVHRGRARGAAPRRTQHKGARSRVLGGGFCVTPRAWRTPSSRTASEPTLDAPLPEPCRSTTARPAWAACCRRAHSKDGGLPTHRLWLLRCRRRRVGAGGGARWRERADRAGLPPAPMSSAHRVRAAAAYRCRISRTLRRRPRPARRRPSLAVRAFGGSLDGRGRGLGRAGAGARLGAGAASRAAFFARRC